jgi:hypothetical protein
LRWFACFALLSLIALPCAAEDAPAENDAARSSAQTPSVPPPPAASKRALSLGAAVVPGILVRGAGHYALGRKDTAFQLLALEGVGLGMILGGGGVVVLSGASRYVVGPAAAIAAMGFGVFGTSLLADMYGSVSPDSSAARSRRRLLPVLETEFGYRRVEDVQFAHHDFLAEGFRLNQRGVTLGFLGLFSLGADNARYRGEIGYRFLDDDSADSTYRDRLELNAGFVRHMYAADGFAMTSGELSASARCDLARFGDTLSGSFAEFGLGYARGAISYDLPGVHVPSDGYDLLLARFGFGVRLRGKSAPGSEALLYYDHRHDDFAAGLKVTGLGSGVLGHFGLQTKWFFNSSFGLLADVSVGSAWVFGGSLLLRQAQPSRPEQPR